MSRRLVRRGLAAPTLPIAAAGGLASFTAGYVALKALALASRLAAGPHARRWLPGRPRAALALQLADLHVLGPGPTLSPDLPHPVPEGSPSPSCTLVGSVG